MKCREATRGGSSSVGATWGVEATSWGTEASSWGTEVTSWGTEATWGAPSAEDVVSSPWAASWTGAASSSDTVEFPPASSYLPPSGEERGKTYNHYNDFFAAREKRQKEMMKVKSSRDCQARESRERNPGVKHARVYEWEKTQSSGGREVYQRVKVNKKRNEDVYSFYKPYQRLYNAFANEWDLCEEFTIGKKDDEDSDSDSEYDAQNYYPDYSTSQPMSSLPGLALPTDVTEPGLDAPMDAAVALPTDVTEPGLDAPMDAAEPEDGRADQEEDSRDLIEVLSHVYGYVPHLHANGVSSIHNWDAILRFLGFVGDLGSLSAPEPEKTTIINFFHTAVSNANDIDNDFQTLESLFAFEDVQRPCKDLFVFSSPPSDACQWVLGVHSPAAALYVCRYILENPQAHTILTVARRLLDRGIAFRTLLPLPCSPRQMTVTHSYSPRTYRLMSHNFTKADFDIAMLACQSVLSSPQGRAALLRGGIVGRIAREHLSKDGVLDGPSVEVTAHRVGYIASSGGTTQFCDDELTDNEIAIICGTYSLYTGKFIFFPFAFFCLILTSSAWSSCRLVMVPPPSSLGSKSLWLQLAYLDGTM